MAKTVYQDPIDAANRSAELLRKQGCDMVICLSHLGDKYDDNRISDEIIAKESYDIDLIIGGHTHRFFEEPRKYREQERWRCCCKSGGLGRHPAGQAGLFFFRFQKKKNLSNAHTVVIGKKTRE
jgi:5'-nucleotidase